MTDSLPYPFENAGIQNIFDGMDVLEIGPGNGRQYERAHNRTKSYCLADISEEALMEPVFDDVAPSNKFILSSWEQSLGRQFDVIHFWYVLHHVMLIEMKDFFSFVRRHLRSGGLAAFNCPEPQNVQGFYEGNGTDTTYSDPSIVQLMARPMEMLMAAPIQMKSTGYVILLQAK